MTVTVQQNVQCICISLCTQPMGMYVLYSTAVVVVMQYAHYGVWCPSKVSVWAGTNGHQLPLLYTCNLPNAWCVTESAEY